VDETRAPEEHFGPAHESNLNNIIANEYGTENKPPARNDLPLIAASIPAKPPVGFPKPDPAKPDATDFQLQQALVVVGAMAEQRRSALNSH
jgi:carboxyl-terminal processing protease